MRHRQIEAFRAVMVAGTITEAAKLLRISQPSVSRLISDLEASLPFALFERQHGRVSPTPEAVLFFEETERSYESLERVLSFARELGNFREAQLTVAAMPGLCLDLVPQAVARFRIEHAKARIAVHARSSQQVLEWIIAQKCELGLSAPPFDVRGVTVEMAVSAPGVCALPPDHRLVHRPALTPGDLAEERLILLTGSSLSHQLEAMTHDGGNSLPVQIETPLSIVACRMVELGQGISVVDPFTAEFYKDRDIVFRPFEPVLPFSFGVISPAGRSRSRGSAKMIKLLEDTLKNYPVGVRIEKRA